MGQTPIPDLVWSTPSPFPVSPLIYGKKGGLNRGDNAVNKIFPEIFWKSDYYPYFRKKIFPEIFEKSELLFIPNIYI